MSMWMFEFSVQKIFILNYRSLQNGKSPISEISLPV